MFDSFSLPFPTQFSSPINAEILMYVFVPIIIIIIIIARNSFAPSSNFQDMAQNHVTFFLLFASSCLCCCCCLLVTGSKPVGFTVDLVHIDSPVCPLYNTSATRFSKLKNAIHRSISRATLLLNRASASSLDTIQAPIFSGRGEYLMEVSVGTPPSKIFAIADTGSDLTWTQCKPCKRCFKQPNPIFNPLRSSSYGNISCRSQICKEFTSTTCRQSACEYLVRYGDESMSIGELATETFTFKSASRNPISVKMAFGCGHDNIVTFGEETSGVIGLGGGSLSLVNQLHESVKGIFSYCLVPVESPPNVTSKINFGSDGLVSGPGVVSTPLILKKDDILYYVTLEGISVGQKRLTYKILCESSKQLVREGNMFIDSGTTITFLPKAFYLELISELKSTIKAMRVKDPQGFLDLCYRGRDGSKLGAPKVTAHFRGADVILSPSSLFVRVADDAVCLAMMASAYSQDSAIFGNLLQTNLLIGYDLVKKAISFKPTDCTKH